MKSLFNGAFSFMRERSLRNIFLVALLAASALPLFNILAVYPSFIESIVNGAENQSVRLAGHLGQNIRALNCPVDRLGDSKEFLRIVSDIERDFDVMKIKAYAPDGRITYSTDRTEIGERNESPEFMKVAAGQEIYSELVKKETRTLEGALATRDVVETYVPITSGGAVTGVFEIYVNVSEKLAGISRLNLLSSTVVIIAAVAFLALLTLVLANAAQSMERRRAAEEALAKVNESLEAKVEKRAEALRREAATRAAAEKDLRESEKRFRAIFHYAGIGVGLADVKGHVVEANPAMLSMLGYSPQELQSMPFSQYTHPEDAAKNLDLFQSMLRGEIDAYHMEKRYLRKDGGVIWCRLTVSLVRDASGDSPYVVALVENINERKKAEMELADLNRRLEGLVNERTQVLAEKASELESANARLRELDDLKTSFLSSVSHELRTPLTSLLGFAKLIGRDFSQFFMPPVDDAAKRQAKGERIIENLDIIVSEGQRLTRLINNVLDIQKIESGAMDWNDAPTDPSELVSRAVNAVSGHASEKPDVSLETSVSLDLPQVMVDADKIVQVLINLLNNALKFTDRGSVRVEVLPGEDKTPLFRVVDSGPGIPEGELVKVFEKYHQVHREDALTVKQKGTGLGLPICRQIVEHYGGAIWAAPGQQGGTIFSFTLPQS